MQIVLSPNAVPVYLDKELNSSKSHTGLTHIPVSEVQICTFMIDSLKKINANPSHSSCLYIVSRCWHLQLLG